ncbi:MAG: CoA-transferase [Betaproteobacteria bacterium SG8_39]|nr:MAG: CoA-transferase [Betaproteobacteria bacterium SG8_39]
MAAEERPGSAPLEGLRVLAVEQYGAGPWGSLYLADLGAEVIKIENPQDGGDVSRRVGPHFFAPGDSQFFHTFNRNKKSIALDLKHPEGAAVFRDLAASADALLDNLRGDVPAKIGLTYAQLKAVNPRLVCAHLSAYGREGSRAAWPGYDFLMQAEAGYLTLTGEPGTPPAKFGLSMIDLASGLACALGLLAAVMKARATGRGCDLDTSLFDVALHHLNYPATWYLNAGAVTGRQPRSAHPSMVPSQLYTTQDGWIFVMCNKEKFWRVLAEALGHPEWCADPRFADFAARLEHRAALQALLDAAFAERTTAEWLERLSGKVPVAPVRDVGEALDNAFVHERADVADYTRTDGAPVRMVANPLRMPEVTLPMQAAPALGADTDVLLGSLGYDAERLAALRACGAIG